MTIKPVNILVIEDSETGSLLIKAMFEDNSKYCVAIAHNCSEAMRILNKNKFDLILLDIMLPKIDGYEILKKLKSKEELKDIPVIIVSALQHDNDVKKAFELGAIDYVKKPIYKNNLYERVEALFQK